ncbi:zinc finger protein 264-like isoform X1 [Folsomia candida]|uniref:zinc finger protein 264-like isoform X1 n=1 Tax=Folsomia candida TaxID=158441 RepID=UPI001604ED9F|nr:zinc finger protein 264-like isoform X1 [Folsomia candida]
MKQVFNQHVITHDPDAKIKCQVCRNISKNRATLLDHMRRIHSNRERPNCDLCDRTFCNSRSLLGHMNAVHGSRERSRFPCTFSGCGKTYLSRRAVSRHVKAEHAKNPVRFPCTLCAKEFKHKPHLELHISTHTTEKPFKCSTCGRGFVRIHGMQQHQGLFVSQVTHVEKSAVANLKCTRCPLTFCSSSSLREHIQVFHENQKNHPCKFCGKRFSGSNDLQRHVEAVHPASEDKINSCDKCEYKSHSKHNLVRHKARHDVKKHECYFCGNRFVCFRNLVRHCGLIHTLEK